MDEIIETDEQGNVHHGGAFGKELEGLINRYSQENFSNTPDFILAHYLVNCLLAFNYAMQQRDHWYGRVLRPGLVSGSGGCSGS